MKTKTCGFFIPQSIKSRRDSLKKYEISYEKLEKKLKAFLYLMKRVRKQLKRDCDFLL